MRDTGGPNLPQPRADRLPRSAPPSEPSKHGGSHRFESYSAHHRIPCCVTTSLAAPSASEPDSSPSAASIQKAFCRLVSVLDQDLSCGFRATTLQGGSP